MQTKKTFFEEVRAGQLVNSRDLTVIYMLHV